MDFLKKPIGTITRLLAFEGMVLKIKPPGFVSTIAAEETEKAKL
ncbi:hypothetical protein GAMM_30017 [Gammaproteobacteria bacterium]